MVAAVGTDLDAAVSSGKLSATQASKMLADLQAQLPAMLTTPVGSAQGDRVSKS